MVCKGRCVVYQCEKCGACCRNLDKSEIYMHLDRGDGCCIYYNDETKLCSIYDSRPIICRVDDIYETQFKNIIDKESYYLSNHEACKKLREMEE